MDHAHTCRVIEIEQEITIGNGIERIRDRRSEPKCSGGRITVERIGGACERRRTERIHIGRIERLAQAIEITREHPVVRHEMMREQHGLSMLKMRIAWEQHLFVLRRKRQKRLAQLQIRIHQFTAKLFRVETCVGDDLIVSRATGVQTRTRISDALGEHRFDGHMNVLVIDIEDEVALFDVALDLRKSCRDRFSIFMRDDTLIGKHARMRHRPSDILLVHCLIDR